MSVLRSRDGTIVRNPGVFAACQCQHVKHPTKIFYKVLVEPGELRTAIFDFSRFVKVFCHIPYLAQLDCKEIKPDDGFPQKMCSKCKEDVNSAYLLRNRSYQSNIQLMAMGYPKITKNIVKHEENMPENENLSSEMVNLDYSNPETNNDSNNVFGLPELKVEVECDRLQQDGDETKWPLKRDVKKPSRKEKRQMYLNMVEGKFDPKGPVTCKICKKTVSKWTCFISHAKLHLGFNFVCEFCGKSFISSTQLKRHCRSYHGMKRELPCQHCSFLALDNAQLKLHERRVHTLERPYICDECGASYHSRRCLLQHLESHRTVASVQCSQCSQTFKSSRQLSRHRYRVHKYSRVQATRRTNIEDMNTAYIVQS